MPGFSPMPFMNWGMPIMRGVPRGMRGGPVWPGQPHPMGRPMVPPQPQ